MWWVARMRWDGRARPRDSVEELSPCSRGVLLEGPPEPARRVHPRQYGDKPDARPVIHPRRESPVVPHWRSEPASTAQLWTGAWSIFVVEGVEYDTAQFDKRPKLLHYLPRTLSIIDVQFDHADIYRVLWRTQRRASSTATWTSCFSARNSKSPRGYRSTCSRTFASGFTRQSSTHCRGAGQQPKQRAQLL